MQNCGLMAPEQIANQEISKSLSSPRIKALDLTNSISDGLILVYAASLSLPITIPWTVLTAGIVILLMQFVLFKEQFFSQIQSIFRGPLTVPIVAFSLAVFISGAANGGISEAIKSAQGLRGMLVYFWAYWAFARNANLKIPATSAIITVSSIAGLSAAIEQLSGYHPFSIPYLQGTGFLSGPMAYSGLAQLFFLLVLCIALKDGRKSLTSPLNKPVLFNLVILGNFLGLLFCSERSAWLGAISAVLIISALFSRRMTIITSISLLLTTIGAWLLLPVVRERIVALIHWQTDVSVGSRLILWHRAWQVFQESPIFGIGIRHFPHIRIEEALKQGHVALDHAHSNYLHVLATTGILGISAYFYLWYSALKLGYLSQKDSQYSKLEQGIYLGVFAGIVSLAISGLFEYNFGTGQVRLAQWFLLAMLPLVIKKPVNIPSPPNKLKWGIHLINKY